ncbi:hypothetical protein E5222_14120 [Alteraurantiacibacter aquimixticola]|uniref:Uncharacterized protein n=1 Tax=Alteraurantiacibacter aquimixticola TaxID=2489173 RepID=A0A4T3EZA4_9SPHN|nr:hypothetical protein E5222_14120 [Alteraurantiacibacter aquimixticola]
MACVSSSSQSSSAGSSGSGAGSPSGGAGMSGSAVGGASGGGGGSGSSGAGASGGSGGGGMSCAMAALALMPSTAIEMARVAAIVFTGSSFVRFDPPVNHDRAMQTGSLAPPKATMRFFRATKALRLSGVHLPAAANR